MNCEVVRSQETQLCSAVITSSTTCSNLIHDEFEFQPPMRNVFCGARISVAFFGTTKPSYISSVRSFHRPALPERVTPIRATG